jgi:RNA polymerase sigma factor (sigma-70 family)
MEEIPALVVVGSAADARRDRIGTAEWLRELAGELDEAFVSSRLASFGVAQGDELWGLLAPDADPLPAVLRAALGPRARRMRWVAIRGHVDPGEGSAAERGGRAVNAAREAMKEARCRQERLILRTGSAETDVLLSELTPVLADLLEGLTTRQREVARLALVEGLRQSAVAERLGVRRATISVSFGRARVGSMARLLSAIRRVSAQRDPQPPATES